MKTLGAFTRVAGDYPPYTNISLDGEAVVITVRGEASQQRRADGLEYIAPGATVEHRMHVTDFKKLIGEAVSELITANTLASDSTKALLRRSFESSMSP